MTNEHEDVIPETQSSAEEARRADQLVGKAVGFSIAIVGIAAVVAGVVWLVTRPRASEEKAPPPVVGPSAAKEPPKGALVKIPFTSCGPVSGILFDRQNGALGEKMLPETMGGGVALADFDGDDKPEVLLINGIPWPWVEDQPAHLPTSQLFHNTGGGNFVEVTNQSGLDIPLQGMGVAVGDYDGDGRTDIFITAVGDGPTGKNRLFRNVTEKSPVFRFEDVTDKAGLPATENQWGTSAGFLDYDRDGDLDLFVCNYVEWNPDIDRKVGYQLTGLGRAYGPPDGFAGVDCTLYRNEGDGTFKDVTEPAGIMVKNPATGKPVGKALGVTFVDVDRDGFLDILVANDKVMNFAFRNKGDGTFEQIAAPSGFAYDRNGTATAAMGIDASWFRNDERIAVAIGNFANEMSSLYVTEPKKGTAPRFADDAIPEGIGPATRKVLSFGTLFFDADLDGWEDFLQINGHLENDINRVYRSQQYLQPGLLFRNVVGIEPHGPAFVELPAGMIGDVATPIVGRGAAYADLDSDGDLDLVCTQPKGQPVVLRNELETRNGWVRLKLVGNGKNTSAIGAEVDLFAGDAMQRKHVMPSRSYLSACELPLTFGLGMAARVDKVRVRWPDGNEEIIDGAKIPVGKLTTIRQGEAAK
ncbi:MAG: CRTAC1 family protein [Phycisphaerae bacterium]|nr:CRTAC1 family protein [Phycisphaerae bacterium]